MPYDFNLGTKDKMTPRRSAQPLIDALAEPTVIEPSGVGHMSMTEAPKKGSSSLI